MTIILCLAAVAGAVSLYARGSKVGSWDATWSKILVSGTAGAVLAYATAPIWWAAALVGIATSAGHAGWTGLIHPLGDHDGVFPLLDDRPDDWRAWVSGALSGAQITLPMAVVTAGAGTGLFGVMGNPITEQYQILADGAGVVIAPTQLVTGAYTLAAVVLLAGMLRPLDYWLAPKIRPTGNPVPVAEAMYSARCWVAMLGATLVTMAV